MQRELSNKPVSACSVCEADKENYLSPAPFVSYAAHEKLEPDTGKHMCLICPHVDAISVVGWSAAKASPGKMVEPYCDNRRLYILYKQAGSGGHFHNAAPASQTEFMTTEDLKKAVKKADVYLRTQLPLSLIDSVRRRFNTGVTSMLTRLVLRRHPDDGKALHHIRVAYEHFDTARVGARITEAGDVVMSKADFDSFAEALGSVCKEAQDLTDYVGEVKVTKKEASTASKKHA